MDGLSNSSGIQSRYQKSFTRISNMLKTTCLFSNTAGCLENMQAPCTLVLMHDRRYLSHMPD